MTVVSLWLGRLEVVSLLAVAFYGSLAAYSLRDFSRSRLEEACRRHQREARFSVILKQYEYALLSVELLTAAALIALLSLSLPMLAVTGAGSGEPGSPWRGAGAVAGMIGVVWLSLIVLPWTIARVAGERFLCRNWPFLALLMTLFRPLTAVARRLDMYVHRLTGLEEPDEDDNSSLTEEIRSVIDEGQREGVIESEARTMIHRVIELSEESVSAIMTPRTEMISIPADASLDVARQQFLECGHSRIPVVGDSTDDIVGILYAKDLLKHLNSESPSAFDVRSMVREPLYVPETIGIDTLLQTMKRDRVHFALVIDEYGGVAGLVTMEDILEEIVGEIGDEYDAAEEPGIIVLSPSAIEVESWVRIDELNERFEYELPEDEDFDTIGGFVFSQLGRIPRSGESFIWKQIRIAVLSADKRKIDKLRIDFDESLPESERED